MILRKSPSPLTPFIVPDLTYLSDENRSEDLMRKDIYWVINSQRILLVVGGAIGC